MALTATPPHCSGGKLCTTINNDGDAAVTVTVDIFVCSEQLTQANVVIPAHDATVVCVTPVTAGECVASVQVAGVQLSSRNVTVPC